MGKHHLRNRGEKRIEINNTDVSLSKHVNNVNRPLNQIYVCFFVLGSGSAFLSYSHLEDKFSYSHGTGARVAVSSLLFVTEVVNHFI